MNNKTNKAAGAPLFTAEEIEVNSSGAGENFAQNTGDNLRQKYADSRVPIIRSESEKLLISLVSKANPSRILEFGTAVGFSAISMLNATAGTIVTIEIDNNRANEARSNITAAGLERRAVVLVGDDRRVAEDLVAAKEEFDFVFLDSAKGQYINLLPNILKLLKSGGTLVADNVLFRGYVYGDCPKRYKTIAKRLRDFIAACKGSLDLINVKVYDVEDGVLVAVKR